MREGWGCLNKYVVYQAHSMYLYICKFSERTFEEEKNINTHERRLGRPEQICCVPSTQNVCIHHQAGSLIIQQTTKTLPSQYQKQQRQQQPNNYQQQ